jgi:hypothetical protein
VSSGAIIPARAPASIDMLQIVRRPSIERARTASPPYSKTWPTPPATPIRPIAASTMSFAVRPNGSSPVKSTFIVRGSACGRVWVASTCSTSDVPIPIASAPNAPCVEVWLSPQTIVIPGCESPSSGPITCTIPSRPAAGGEEPHAEFVAVPLQCVELRARERIGHGPGERRHVVVHGRDGEIGPAHRSSCRTQAVERLRARHLVDEVEVDVQQRKVAVADDMRVPHLAEERATAHRARSAA